MKCIVGLGNPEKKYDLTRHNTGFRIIDKVSDKTEIPFDKKNKLALYGLGNYHNEKVLLVKPLTYMNLSGKAVRYFMDYYKIPLENILIIYDDMDIPLGSFKLKPKGNSGGHNGLKSIFEECGSTQIKRIKVGIGDRGNYAGMDYVLSKFTSEEMKLLEEKTDPYAVNAACAFTDTPFDKLMSEYNSIKNDE